MPLRFTRQKLEVPDYELCKRLKELGYPQNTAGWFWTREGDGIFFYDASDVTELVEADPVSFYDMHVKAPSVAELGEWLPDTIGTNKVRNGWIVYDISWENIYGDHQEEANTEANARAKMLIWLVENGYVEFDKNQKEEAKV